MSDISEAIAESSNKPDDLGQEWLDKHGQRPKSTEMLELLREQLQPQQRGGLQPAAADPGPGETGVSVVDVAADVARDVGLGAIESPRAIAGGVRDAFQETWNFVDATVAAAEKAGLPNVYFQVFDQDGNFDPQMIDQAEVQASRDAGNEVFTLPQIAEPESTTGGLVRDVTQFVTGFMAGGKALQFIKPATTAGRMGKAAAQGGIADAVTMDPHEQRLSNLLADSLADHPEAQAVVNEYLAAQIDDGEFEGRLKAVTEGALAGTLLDGLVTGVRFIRNARLRRQGIQPPAPEYVPAAPDLSALGDVEAPLVSEVAPQPQRTPAATAAERAAGNLGALPDTPQGDVFINFARIDTPEDVQTIMRDLAERGRGGIEGAARGKRTFEQIELDADQQDAWDVLVNRREGQPLNDAESVALRRLWVSSAEKMKEVANAAAEDPSAANLFAFRKMMAVHHTIQMEAMAARRETARALASWRIPVGGTTEMARGIDQAIEMMGGADATQEMARRISALAETGTPEQLDAVVRGGAMAKTWDAFLQVWVNGLLSGPQTHIVNSMSNVAVLFHQMFERSMAGRMASMVGSEGGVQVGEALAQWQGLVGGIGDALRYSARSMITGESGYGLGKLEVGRPGSLAAEAWNMEKDTWAGRAMDVLDTVTTLPGRALTAEDEFFKTLGYRMELHAQALRQASQEVNRGVIPQDQLKERIAALIADPPENIRLAAVDQAMYQTFTNKPGKVAQIFTNATRSAPPLKVILPFIRTPANLTRYTFERTPLAPLVSQWRADIAAGGARGDLALARMSTGTMALMAFADMAMAGNITGNGPETTGERQAWLRSGKQPYSVKIGDRWFSYRRADPMGMHMGIVADLVETLNNGDLSEEMEADAEKAVTATMAAIANTVMSKTYLTGISSLMNAVSDPERYAESFVRGFTGSLVPTGVANVARAIDPVTREARNIADRWRSRIPGLSQDLPPARDLWGRVRTFESGLGTVYDVASPIYSRKENPEPIDSEILRLGANVLMPGRRQGFDAIGQSVTVDLDRYPGAYSRMLELQGSLRLPKYMGQTLLDFLNATVQGEGAYALIYGMRTDGEDGSKADFIKDVIRDYREAAKDALLVDYPELRANVADAAEAALQQKLMLNPTQ